MAGLVAYVEGVVTVGTVVRLSALLPSLLLLAVGCADGSGGREVGDTFTGGKAPTVRVVDTVVDTAPSGSSPQTGEGDLVKVPSTLRGAFVTDEKWGLFLGEGKLAQGISTFRVAWPEALPEGLVKDVNDAWQRTIISSGGGDRYIAVQVVAEIADGQRDADLESVSEELLRRFAARAVEELRQQVDLQTQPICLWGASRLGDGIFTAAVAAVMASPCESGQIEISDLLAP